MLHTTVLCDDKTNSAFEMFLQAMGGKMKDLHIRHDSYSGVLLSWTKYLSFCQSLEDVQIKYGPISILKDISKLSNLKLLQLDQIGRYDSEHQKSQMISKFFEAFDIFFHLIK